MTKLEAADPRPETRPGRFTLEPPAPFPREPVPDTPFAAPLKEARKLETGLLAHEKRPVDELEAGEEGRSFGFGFESVGDVGLWGICEEEAEVSDFRRGDLGGGAMIGERVMARERKIKGVDCVDRR